MSDQTDSESRITVDRSRANLHLVHVVKHSNDRVCLPPRDQNWNDREEVQKLARYKHIEKSIMIDRWLELKCDHKEVMECPNLTRVDHEW